MKQSRLWRVQVILFCLCIAPATLMAQDTEGADIDYSEMSLEDLLNVEVVTASKQAESAWDAAAVITTVTASEIEQFGAIQLRELLERVTGVTPNHGDGIYYGGVLRGGDTNPDSANVHTLILLNGRPVRDSYNGSSNQIPLAVIPVNGIERIEIIRGPGSVLYGTNGFEGVINIITKTAAESGFTFSAGGGSDDGQNVGLTASYVKDDLKLNISANKFKEDGPTYTTPSFFGTPQGADNSFQDNLGIVATLDYKGFSLDYYHADNDYNLTTFGPDFFPLMIAGGQDMINLGYEFSINDNWSLQTNLTRNDTEFFLQDDPRFPPSDFKVKRNSVDTLVEPTLFGKISDKFGILIGAVYENITGGGDGSEIPVKYDESRWSTYFQGDYKINPKFKVIIGGQYNKVENISGDFVPRIGMIANFNDNAGVKLLYGHAFRSPAKLQTSQDAPGLVGPNPSIEPEKTKTTDLQFFFNKGRYQAALTLFNNDEENLIGIKVQDDETYPTIFDNLGDRTIRGLEIEGKLVPNDHIYLLGSYVYNESESGDGIDGITLSPENIFKAGASYTSKAFSVAGFWSHFSAYGDNVLLFPDRQIINPESSSFDSITLNFAYHFTVNNAKFDLQLYGRNLQDKEIYEPFVEGSSLNTFTVGNSAQYYLKLKVKI